MRGADKTQPACRMRYSCAQFGGPTAHALPNARSQRCGFRGDSDCPVPAAVPGEPLPAPNPELGADLKVMRKRL